MDAKTEDFYAEVGRRVRERRKGKGMTQESLAKALSPQMTRVSIANIESGSQRILSHTLVQIADALTVSLADILPQKSNLIINNIPDITNELASKLGISKSQAKKLADEAKKS